MPRNIVQLILAKRDGEALSEAEISWLVEAYTSDRIPDYQMAAFLMATVWRGMDTRETTALTRAMLESGSVLDLSGIPGIKVDKHSTGGVGDKVSLILAPIVAAAGVPVPMISGRGLMHSGGTLDKLEAIPGFNVNLSPVSFVRQLEEIGVSLGAATESLAPADRRMYALRDVTGTVESVPLIAASILSKKLAEGIDSLVLDVKFGNGAFMKTEAEAQNLAEVLVQTGRSFGKEVVAWLTEMESPLGKAVGNWPETEEAIRCLKGEKVSDLLDVTLVLSGEMIRIGGKAATVDGGIAEAKRMLESGAALAKFADILKAQGGDVRVLETPEVFRQETGSIMVDAQLPQGKFVSSIDAGSIGWTAVALGAGRERKEDVVDPGAGLVLHKKPGDWVENKEVLATLYTRKTPEAERYSRLIRDAFTFSDEKVEPISKVRARYDGIVWEVM